MTTIYTRYTTSKKRQEKETIKFVPPANRAKSSDGKRETGERRHDEKKKVKKNPDQRAPTTKRWGVNLGKRSRSNGYITGERKEMQRKKRVNDRKKEKKRLPIMASQPFQRPKVDKNHDGQGNTWESFGGGRETKK